MAKIREPRMQRDVPRKQQTSLLSQEAKSRLGLDRTKLTTQVSWGATEGESAKKKWIL